MKSILQYISPLLWTEIFVFICGAVGIAYIYKNERKRIFEFILILVLGMVLCASVSSLFKNWGLYINNIMQFSYEIFVWIILIGSALYKKQIVNKKIVLDKSEKTIFIVSFCFGFLCILAMAFSNLIYMYPQDEFGHINDCYFNADIYNSVQISFEIDVKSHVVHPVYRFLQLPFTLPIMILVNFIKILGVRTFCNLFN